MNFQCIKICFVLKKALLGLKLHVAKAENLVPRGLRLKFLLFPKDGESEMKGETVGQGLVRSGAL